MYELHHDGGGNGSNYDHERDRDRGHGDDDGGQDCIPHDEHVLTLILLLPS